MLPPISERSGVFRLNTFESAARSLTPDAPSCTPVGRQFRDIVTPRSKLNVDDFSVKLCEYEIIERDDYSASVVDVMPVSIQTYPLSHHSSRHPHQRDSSCLQESSSLPHQSQPLHLSGLSAAVSSSSGNTSARRLVVQDTRPRQYEIKVRDDGRKRRLEHLEDDYNVDEEHTQFQHGRHLSYASAGYSGGRLPSVSSASINWDSQPVSGITSIALSTPQRLYNTSLITAPLTLSANCPPLHPNILLGDHLSENAHISTDFPSLDCGNTVPTLTTYRLRHQNGGSQPETDTVTSRPLLSAIVDEESEVFSVISVNLSRNISQVGIDRVSKMAAVSGPIANAKREQFSQSIPPRDRRQTTGNSNDDSEPLTVGGLRKTNGVGTSSSLVRTSPHNSLLTRSSRTLSNSNLSKMSESVSFSTGNSSNAARRNAATGVVAIAQDKDNITTRRGVARGSSTDRQRTIPRNQSDTDINRLVKNISKTASVNYPSELNSNTIMSSVSPRQQKNDLLTTRASQHQGASRRAVGSGPSGNTTGGGSSANRTLVKSTSHPVLGTAATNGNTSVSRSFNGQVTRKKQLVQSIRSRRQTGNGGNAESRGDAEEDALVEAETQKRIIEWLKDVYEERPDRPPSPETLDDDQPPQTDTAIHIVYGGDK